MCTSNSSVAVGCVLPGRAKDLSAPLSALFHHYQEMTKSYWGSFANIQEVTTNFVMAVSSSFPPT